MSKLRRQEGGRVAFLCPGCGDCHSLPVEGPQAWQWNGSLESPTFSPSILARSGHYVPGDHGGCWCTYRKDHPEENLPDSFNCGVCHSFVKDGTIQFLSDCTHKLAGQTVVIPEWE